MKGREKEKMVVEKKEREWGGISNGEIGEKKVLVNVIEKLKVEGRRWEKGNVGDEERKWLLSKNKEKGVEIWRIGEEERNKVDKVLKFKIINDEGIVGDEGEREILKKNEEKKGRNGKIIENKGNEGLKKIKWWEGNIKIGLEVMKIEKKEINIELCEREDSREEE